MNQESNKIKKLFDKLITSEAHNFPALGKKLEATTDKGAYIILSNRDVVLHVGSTPRGKNGINQRLKNHLSNSSSFVRSYLDGDGSKLRKGHCYKYLTVDNARYRVLLEAYATGELCPKHLGTGST